MTNITMLTYGRPRLLEQALRTLAASTDPKLYTLTTFNDDAKMGTGPARNEVIRLSQERHGRGDYLYLSDCDVAFTDGWLETLTAAYRFAAKELQVGLIGGYCHPYHQPFERHVFGIRDIGITWALPTQSMLTTWEIWDKYGPFVDTPPGKVNMSEDWNFTERLRADGLRTAAIYPHVVLNTARHNSFGELQIGHELVKDIDGLVVE